MRYQLPTELAVQAAMLFVMIFVALIFIVRRLRREPQQKAVWLSLFSIGVAYMTALVLLVISGHLLDEMPAQWDHPYKLSCAVLALVFTIGALLLRVRPLKALLHLLPSLVVFTFAYLPPLIFYSCSTTPVCL
ncbi:hypothetical protein ACPA5B_14095 [Pseudomonas solani]|uniref:hypothetical protein n=1 Tax=Pseudomonas solani TaxID=2731552 RepID=UPI003C3084E9